MQGIFQDNNIMGTYLNDIDSKMANKYTTPRRKVHYLIKKNYSTITSDLEQGPPVEFEPVSFKNAPIDNYKGITYDDDN